MPLALSFWQGAGSSWRDADKCLCFLLLFIMDLGPYSAPFFFFQVSMHFNILWEPVSSRTVLFRGYLSPLSGLGQEQDS